MAAPRVATFRQSRHNAPSMFRARVQFRRLAVLTAIAVVFGVSVHGLCQVIEHHGDIGDAAALCAAALGIVAAISLSGGSRRGALPKAPWWFMASAVLTPTVQAYRRSTSPAWLQRFRN